MSSWFPLGAFPDLLNFTEDGNMYSDGIWSSFESSYSTTDAERDKFLFSALSSSETPENYIQLDMFRKFPAHLKVAAAYELRQTARSLPKVETSFTVKSVATSLEYRNTGNTYFRNGKFVDALKWYCEGIATAPQNSPELAIAFANRSAVLFKLKRYRSSLLDINRALQGNYPDSLRSKLINRKRECVSIITESVDIRRGSAGSLKKSTMDETKAQLDEDATDAEFVDPHPLPVTNFHNTLLPNTSDKVIMDVSKKAGRHLRAARNIKPGEILLFEKPFTSKLDRTKSTSHCAFCFSRSETLIPCDGCSQMMFCGRRCRDAALTLFHQVECEYMDYAVELGLGEPNLLCLRMLLIATEQGSKLPYLLEQPIAKNPFLEEPSSPNTKFIADYAAVCSSESICIKNLSTYPFLFAMAAVNCLHLLKSTSFFDSLKDARYHEKVYGDVTEAESRVGTLIMKQLQVILVKNHAIAELIESRSPSPDNIYAPNKLWMEKKIGEGFYPLLNLVKHSCDPNVAAISYGDTLVLYAIQPITAGEQLLQSHGCEYINRPLSERRRILRNIGIFNCECRACKSDWALQEELPSRHPRFVSKTNAADLKKLKTYQRKLHTILKKTEKSVSDFEFVCQYLSLLSRCVEKPWKEFAYCTVFILCMLARRGNHYLNEDYSIMSLEEIRFNLFLQRLF